MGYIAPELYSRSFGAISYKSDVYSFGMLVLEMVSGRRNSDPTIENQNEFYFPEWIYERVINGQDLVLTMDTTEGEKVMVRQLALTALWCIQWNPKDRPSMTKVVNMLTGRLQNLQVPPKPFISSENHLVIYEFYVVTARDDEDFFKICSSQWCSKDGPEIRFPFRFSTQPSSCGAPGMELSCYGQDTILDHPALGSCKVTAIYYMHGIMNIIPLVDSSPHCPLQKLISVNQSTAVYKPSTSEVASLVGCSKDSIDTNQYSIVGPASCLTLTNNTSQFWYLVDPYAYMSILPLGCKIAFKGIPMPYSYDKDSPYFGILDFKETANRVISSGETVFTWYSSNITSICQQCEHEGRRCGFSSQRDQAFCQHHSSHVKLIAATSSVTTFIVLSLIVATVLYISLKSRYDEEVYFKVEMFLKTYGTSKPTRYTFSDVKKIARRFKDKLGHGGFGSVYKGELPNGVPVAVKMLEKSFGEGEEFINEVATIGRIHHANIVRLLGFCSEGTRRALIYEFMPNESLEKYIFPNDYNISREFLVPDKMLDIALGIAQGMEYLHQGCNQRILHFDIKPHNILLDYSFNPKISDFGLAKLCARDQSIVTLTAARGTMGYIAPELYSRNFGAISYKSDVYSFGMLVLEMVSGRRNSDPTIENQNEFYFPEWIYERVLNGQDLVLTMETTEGEKEIVRQLAIVALWCIQWNPKNRPSMTKVVNISMNTSFLALPLLLFAILRHGTCTYNHMVSTASDWDDQDFFRHCPVFHCSHDGPEIRFPHRLSNTSSACGTSCARLSCSGQTTILHHPFLGPCKVTSIDYKNGVMNFIPLLSFPCPLQKLIVDSLPPDDYSGCLLYEVVPAKIVSCSKEFIPDGTSPVDGYAFKNNADYIVGPISCPSDTRHFSYLVYAKLYMYVLPLDCRVVSKGSIPIPGSNYEGGPTFKERAEKIINIAETTLSWWSNGDEVVLNNCTTFCQSHYRYCSNLNLPFYSKEKRDKVISTYKFLWLAVRSLLTQHSSTKKDTTCSYSSTVPIRLSQSVDH
uniref:Protein kinase domain-containing protein n=1 Tax=Leersia perrieri TaxID=77586 RepID=A0A0D9UW31_9ORYZ